MEDENLNINVKTNNKSYGKIAILAIVVVVFLLLFRLLFSQDKFDLKGKKFSLSDNSVLSFEEKDQYILNNKIMDNDFVMKGKYTFKYADKVDENIKNQYQNYISKLDTKKYTLGFLELENDEIYIGESKNEAEYISTYYIVVAYYENDVLILDGYNVDTGIRVRFTQINEK